MRSLVSGLAVAAVLLFASSAMAQYSTYYVPAPVITARPVYVAAPVVTTYHPATVAAPTVVYRAAPVVTYPTAPVVVSRPVITAPTVVVGRPAYSFYSPYGGPEIRVPGQPVRNFIRAIVP